MAGKPQLGYALQKCLRNNMHVFCDFTVVIEDVSFPCHKVILNACSNFFQALFRSEMKECQENRVDLHGVTKEAFSVIVDSQYKGFDGLTEENVIDVWHAAVQLQITLMINECECFVKKKMTAQNCLAFYNHAKQLESKKIKGFFFTFVCNNFELCRQKISFDQLSLIDVYNILQNDYLTTDSEDSAVDVVLSWVNYTYKSSSSTTQSQTGTDSESSNGKVAGTTVLTREQDVVKLLSVVRLCLVSNECLRKLFDHDIVISCRETRDMIFKAINYRLSVELRHDSWPDAAVHRATSHMKHAMVFASGKVVTVYLLKNGSTQEYTTLPCSQMASLVVFDNVLYVNECSALRMFSLNKNWETLYESERRSSTVRTRKNMLLSLGTYIYCLDARTGYLQRFDCTYGCDKKWNTCITGLNYVESMIKYKKSILLFGARYGTGEVFHFCPDSGKCFSMSPHTPVSGPLDAMFSFVYCGTVFILQKNGYLWKVVDYQGFEIDFEFVCEFWSFEWEIYGCIIYQKRLFIFGSKNCPHKPAGFLWPTSLPGVIDKVKVIQIQSDTPCLPIVINLNQ